MALTLLIVCSALFAVTHIGLSHGAVRERLVTSLGEWPFRGLYSLVSFLTLGPAFYIAWTSRHLGPVLYDLPFWLERAVAVPLMLFALLLLVLAFATPSPTGMVPARPEARGVLRITRHPMNMGLAAFGLAHLVANGALGDVVFFGCCFVLVGVVGAIHQDRRKARERGQVFADFRSETSVLPFAAILTHRNRFSASELPLPMVFIAIVVWAALLVFHGRLFGAPLLW